LLTHQGRQQRENPKAKKQTWFQGVFHEAAGTRQKHDTIVHYLDSILATQEDNKESDSGALDHSEVYF